MIRRKVTGMNGEEVIELIPENEADEGELDELDRRGLLDRRFSFGDEPNPWVTRKEEDPE